jgi:25S rRNA (adenine2142-N1)-methyltransferase
MMTPKVSNNNDSSSNGNNKKRRRRSLAGPLARPPTKSRKRARQVTTFFHKYTRQKEEAFNRGDHATVERIERQLEEMGGRREYQRASQISTSHHSTSKWVLGYLDRKGWLYGIKEDNGKKARRPTRLLEVGAINAELLSAAKNVKYRLTVRAIDLHSAQEGIEEADFLTLPVVRDPAMRYDVVVCSMVLNCVTSPVDRGDMLAKWHHHLRPGGHLFLTIPLSCLTLSPTMDEQRFLQLLQIVGLEIQETKKSPKIAFFVCQRPLLQNQSAFWKKVDSPTSTIIPGRKGKKYKNNFAVTLTKDSVTGTNLTYLN